MTPLSETEQVKCSRLDSLKSTLASYFLKAMWIAGFNLYSPFGATTLDTQVTILFVQYFNQLKRFRLFQKHPDFNYRER